MKQASLGHIYGLKTRRGIALLQIAELSATPTSLPLVRICDGFLPEHYADTDILIILLMKERFFMELPLHLMGKRSKIYQAYFAFDQDGELPKGLKLPTDVRGFTVLNDGTVKWYQKKRGGNLRKYISEPTPAFWVLSPDITWNLPDLCEFLESGKTIDEYR